MTDKRHASRNGEEKSDRPNEPYCWTPRGMRPAYECSMLTALWVRASTVSETRSSAKLPSLPEEIQEWCWHMDTHLTEHDLRHAGLALRAAWPHVSKWLQENVRPSDKVGVPFKAEKDDGR
jgi:hypothetical protein